MSTFFHVSNFVHHSHRSNHSITSHTFKRHHSNTMPLTFPQFQDLPVELQLYIVQYAWETTLHNRHTRLVIAFDTSGPHLTKRGPHDLMSVNAFFRKENMRFEQNNIVHAFPGSTMYFDTDTDTLELDF